MTKKILLVLIISLISLLIPTCTNVIHVDLRFSTYKVQTRIINDQRSEELKYVPVWTTYNPKGHKFSSLLLKTLRRKYASAFDPTIGTIQYEGTNYRISNDMEYYVIPQEILTKNADKIVQLFKNIDVPLEDDELGTLHKLIPVQSERVWSHFLKTEEELCNYKWNEVNNINDYATYYVIFYKYNPVNPNP